MRLKSTAVWYDLPGVEAAYMPIGAPSAVDALMNVGHTDVLGNHRMAGRYTATPCVLPTWSAASGWLFSAAAETYLKTGVVPSATWTILARFLNISGVVFGSTFVKLALWPNYPGGIDYIWNEGDFVASPAISTGVAGFVGNTGFRNGIFDKALTGTPALTTELYIGATNNSGAAAFNGTGTITNILVASRTLSPAETWLASRQMAYCEQNPDWNAWSRKRHYFYAPSAAAGRVGIYGARGAVALPGGVRIGTVNDA